MSLNPRALALQGFLLTPIAMAVQGLIAVLIEEERSRVYGRGKAKPTNPIRKANDLTREEVEAKWDLLETRLKNQERKSPESEGIRSSAPSVQSGGFTPDKPLPNSEIAIEQEAIDLAAIAAQESVRQNRIKEDEFILMLCI